MLEEPRSVGPLGKLAVLLGSQAGGEELAGLPAGIDGRDRTVAGAGQRAGALDDLLQNGVQVEACADAQDGRAQPGETVPQHLVLLPQFIGILQRGHLLPDGFVASPDARAAVRLPPNAKG